MTLLADAIDDPVRIAPRHEPTTDSARCARRAAFTRSRFTRGARFRRLSAARARHTARARHAAGVEVRDLAAALALGALIAATWKERDQGARDQGGHQRASRRRKSEGHRSRGV